MAKLRTKLDTTLITSYLMEYTEDWANEYAYIKPEKLRPEWSEALAQGAN